MSENLKKLTGKNPRDFEPVACSLINNSDIELFAELVEKDDFLFDFVKSNVANRLEKACNRSNYLNLLNFLKYYSPSYEEFIVSTLARFADEDLTDRMLEIFESGTDDEKTYCAKFFSVVQDPLALDLLRKNAYSQNPSLASNCASTLGLLQDEDSFAQALVKLDSSDDFECLDGVKFLVAYGDVRALEKILETMKDSSFAENIAGEIPYLCDLLSLYGTDKLNCLYVLNLIINGLGEILGLCQVFDFQLYEIFEKLIKEPKTSASAVVLLNAKDKFDTLTENDEYLFDESKDTKQEILDIKKLLNSADLAALFALVDEELNADSLFVFSALELTDNSDAVRGLLNSDNPTVVLKSLEVLKQFEELTTQDKETALSVVTDENLRQVISAM
ncbi:MAG: hypothetical protein NC191_00280 [Muribaculaceae bacterium]|nr:hypothetical protein [Muribaculaceae bacterium]